MGFHIPYVTELRPPMDVGMVVNELVSRCSDLLAKNVQHNHVPKRITKHPPLRTATATHRSRRIRSATRGTYTNFDSAVKQSNPPVSWFDENHNSLHFANTHAPKQPTMWCVSREVLTEAMTKGRRQDLQRERTDQPRKSDGQAKQLECDHVR